MTIRYSAGFIFASSSRQRANGCGTSGFAEKNAGFCSLMPTARCLPRVSSASASDGPWAGFSLAVPPEGGLRAGFGASPPPHPAAASSAASAPAATSRLNIQALDCGDLFLLRDAEGGAAAAGRDHVGVVDLEARALEALDVVDDRAAHVGQARAVDQDAQAVVLEDLVAVTLRVEGQRVLEAGAAAAAHANAQ